MLRNEVLNGLSINSKCSQRFLNGQIGLVISPRVVDPEYMVTMERLKSFNFFKGSYNDVFELHILRRGSFPDLVYDNPESHRIEISSIPWLLAKLNPLKMAYASA
jgi:hypothetical protein